MPRLPVSKFTINLDVVIWSIPIHIEGTIEMLQAAVRAPR